MKNNNPKHQVFASALQLNGFTFENTNVGYGVGGESEDVYGWSKTGFKLHVGPPRADEPVALHTGKTNGKILAAKHKPTYMFISPSNKMMHYVWNEEDFLKLMEQM